VLPTCSVVPVDDITAPFAARGYTRSEEVGPYSAILLPCLEDNRPQPSLSAGGRRLPLADSLFRQRILRDQRRSLDCNSIGSGLLKKSNVKKMGPRPPPCGSKSLSTSEVLPSPRLHKRKKNGSQSVGLCSVVDSGSGPSTILNVRIF